MNSADVLVYLDNVRLDDIPKENIDNIIKDLETVSKEAERQLKRVISRKFKDAYFKKAGDAYISIEEVLKKIYTENCLEADGSKLFKQLEESVYAKGRKNYTLSRILSECYSLGLRLPKDIIDLVCKCCMCGGCPDQNICHVTCEYCKSIGYTSYSWECEE